MRVVLTKGSVLVEGHGPLGADGEVREVDLVHGVVGSVPLLVEVGTVTKK